MTQYLSLYCKETFNTCCFILSHIFLLSAFGVLSCYQSAFDPEAWAADTDTDDDTDDLKSFSFAHTTRKRMPTKKKKCFDRGELLGKRKRDVYELNVSIVYMLIWYEDLKCFTSICVNMYNQSQHILGLTTFSH